MAGIYDITIEQGATFTFTVTVTGVNMTSYSARMKDKAAKVSSLTLAPVSTDVFSLTTSGGGGISIAPDTNSLITVTMSAATTAALTAPQQGVYDLEYESGAGVVTRILEGRFYVKSEATT